MPLARVRFTDYSNREHVSSIEELLAAAAADPMYPYPYGMLASIFEEKDRPTEGLSMTQLVGKKCLRCQVLQKFVDYEESVEQMFARWRGTVTHAALERFLPPGAVSEVRFWTDIEGLGTLHGQVDLIIGDGVYDLKTTKSVPRWDKPYDNHVEQLQGYRWLANKAHRASDPSVLEQVRNTEFRRLGIYYLSPDEVKPLEVRKSIEVATTTKGANPTKKVKVPDIWSDAYVEALLLPRFERLQQALQQYQESGKLPPYPPGFDFINDWSHRYSATATLCVDSFVKGN